MRSHSSPVSAPASGIVSGIAANAARLGLAKSGVIAAAATEAVVLTNFLGPSGFGRFALVMALAMGISDLARCRVADAIIHYAGRALHSGTPALASGPFQICFVIDCITSVVAAVIMYLSSDVLAEVVLHSAADAPLLRLAALYPLFTAPRESMEAILRMVDRFSVLSLIRAAAAACRAAALMIALSHASALITVIILYITIAGIQSIVLVILGTLAARLREIRLWAFTASEQSGPPLRQLVTFLFFSNLTGTARLFSRYADTITVGYFCGVAPAGLYELPKQITSHLNNLGGTLSEASYPDIVRLSVSGDTNVLRTASQQLTYRTLLATVAFCLVGTLAAPIAIPIVFSETFSETVPLTQIMLWQMLWLPLAWVPGYLLAQNEPRKLTLLTFADTLVFLAALALLTPVFELWGASISGIIRMLVWTWMANHTVRKSIPPVPASAALSENVQSDLHPTAAGHNRTCSGN